MGRRANGGAFSGVPTCLSVAPLGSAMRVPIGGSWQALEGADWQAKLDAEWTVETERGATNLSRQSMPIN